MELKITIPGFDILESQTFAHSTRIADAHRTSPERILQPAMKVGLGELTVRVFDGSTDELRIKRPRTKNPFRILRRRHTADRSGEYLFDARYEVDTNMGHYLVGVIPFIFAARKQLSAELSQEIEIHVIVRENPNPMVLQIFDAIGIPLMATEAKVMGRIVETKTTQVETWLDGKFLHNGGYPMGGLLPEIYDPIQSHFQAKRGGTPEKIFISRKTGRCLQNEDEITELLASHGFQKLYFELDELPVLQQWQIIGGARAISSRFMAPA